MSCDTIVCSIYVSFDTIVCSFYVSCDTIVCNIIWGAGSFDPICTAVCDRCDSSITCRLCRLETHSYGRLLHPRPALQGVRLAVAHSPVAIGNVGGRLEGLSMVAHRASGNKIDNIMVVKEFIIFCVIKHHSGSPITIGNLIW